MGTAMQNMMIYVTSNQKRALQRRAKEKGGSVAAEVRQAIDAYLVGVTPEQLELLDGATKQAQKDIRFMTERLDQTNRKLDAIFAERDKLRRQRASAR